MIDAKIVQLVRDWSNTFVQKCQTDSSIMAVTVVKVVCAAVIGVERTVTPMSVIVVEVLCVQVTVTCEEVSNWQLLN